MNATTIDMDTAQANALRAVADYTERHNRTDDPEAGFTTFCALWDVWSCQPEPDPPVDAVQDLVDFAAWVDADTPAL